VGAAGGKLSGVSGQAARPIVRLADLGDSEELARLRWDFSPAYGEAPTGDFDSLAASMRIFLARGIEESRLAVFVADVGTRLVSNLWVEVVDKVPRPGLLQAAWGYVTNVYTEPEFRNTGLGTKILENATRWAALRKLELLIVWPSDESVDFYQRAGFATNPMLLELDLEGDLLRRSRRMYVTDYDANWPTMFAQERERIQEAIGRWANAIEHVGSTGVPDLGAKPIIDIMVGLEQLSDYKRCVLPLEDIGYEYAAWVDDLAGRHYFRRTVDGVRTHHLHMVETESDFFRKHLLFRDYLRAHPDKATEYYELKKKLAVEFEWDTIGYTEAKTEFIEAVLSSPEFE
jgi:GrpB-like predicted nucleotidyltransferase (UPF0157 family)